MRREMEDGRQETGDWRQETGDGRRETGDGRGYSYIISEKFNSLNLAGLGIRSDGSNQMLMSDLLNFFSLKSNFLVHLKTSDSLIQSFLKSDVSESLRLLTKNDRCERFAQVAHQK